MGGTGSGRGCRGGKATEENFRRFSIADLKRRDVVGNPNRSFNHWKWVSNNERICIISYEEPASKNDFPNLRVRYEREGRLCDYKIRLTTTFPNYGGERWWFICPIRICGRRVGVLYFAGLFACRHCHNFVYASQNEAPHSRLLHKSQKIFERLGGSWADDDYPPKPKGMHWKTYWRRVDQMEAACNASWGLYCAKDSCRDTFM